MSTVGTQVGRIVWHTLNTSDVEKAKDFYTQLLGWETEVWKPGGMDTPIITVNGAGHGDYQSAPEGVPSHWLAHVQVESADEALRRAETHGAEALAPPMDIPEVGRIAVIRDPQGAVFSAYTPETEGPGGEGVFAWDELISDDVESSKRFYADVVGWTTDGMDMGDFVYTIFKRSEEDQGSAGMLPKPDGMQMPNAWVTYVATDDVDATVVKATELGATVFMPGTDIPDVGRIAMLSDPTGAAFGLFTMTES